MTRSGRGRFGRGRVGSRRTGAGQGLVEFAMIVPVIMLLLVGLLEFGFVFDHAMTLNYATREGARGGAAFAAGNATTMVCNTGVDVDKNIIAAVERVLEAPGSQVKLANVLEIRIYRANASGMQIGNSANVWNYDAGNGPVVDGSNLDFRVTSSGWDACGRDNSWTGGVAPDSLGVSIRYRYDFVTPLAAILGFFGPSGTASLTIDDRTVMALNPTD